MARYTFYYHLQLQHLSSAAYMQHLLTITNLRLLMTQSTFWHRYGVTLTFIKCLCACWEGNLNVVSSAVYQV